MIENTLLLAAGWSDPQYWWGVAQVIIGLGLVIFVHELGHFLVAKACGVKCEKFYVGFDFFDIKIGDRIIVPRSLVKWQWGETEYGVGIVPLGGYVKMLGQDDNPANLEKEVERSKADSGASEEELYEPSGLVDRTKMDPRSFLAKTVPQRMAIISAGVIFNILFAIILGAIAFRSGVNYSPTMVGGVTPTGPAWEANLGESEILRVGDERMDEGYHSFLNLAEKIIFDGSEEDAEIELEYLPTGATEPKEMKLTPRQVGTQTELPRIGISPRMSLVIPETTTIDGRSSSNTDPPLLKGDKIVKANGVAVETMAQFQKELVKSYANPVELIVERKKEDPKDESPAESVSITISPDRMRSLGFQCRWGSVALIQKGSPAEKAGFQVDDEILTVNGKTVTNLFALDIESVLHIREKGDEPMVVQVKRNDQTVTLNVTPRMPGKIALVERSEPMPIGIESLGLAIPTTNIVDIITPGGPADKAGIKLGDEIVSMQTLLTKEQKSDSRMAKRGSVLKFEKNAMDWSMAHELIQEYPVGQEYELTFKRGDKETTAKLASAESQDYFMASTGIFLSTYQEVYTAGSWQEAFKLGAMQTWVDLTKVFKFLGKLVRGRISAKNLGGPGTIFVVATSEASQGTSRLLLFLVLLSANLAIINFLPIPVLDGGHMMFLAYEGLFRKPVTEKVQVVLTYAGLLALLALMVFVIWQDVGRISKLF